MSGRLALTYVLPVRMTSGSSRAEMAGYLRLLTGWCEEVIVVDGSSAEEYAENAAAWPDQVRHVAPDPTHACLMGKVAGVHSGLDLARHEHVVIADDDVRYGKAELAKVVSLLNDFDLVCPQNAFDEWPWHARWDGARTLINRCLGGDYPGTLGIRRSRFMSMGGYDGDVIFENLELIRTVQAAGGRTTTPLDLYVYRRPPEATHFWGQRTRQAYDDFASPARMVCWLGILPLALSALVGGRLRALFTAVAASIGMAEYGRRRRGGVRFFPATCSLLAPLWIIERGICAWLAVLQRLRFGGVRYRDSIITTAAHSIRDLRRSTPLPQPYSSSNRTAPAAAAAARVTPYRNGPYLLRGAFELTDQDGEIIESDRRTIALCRCGHSQTRPFCDGTHKLIDFRAQSAREHPGEAPRAVKD